MSPKLVLAALPFLPATLVADLVAGAAVAALAMVPAALVVATGIVVYEIYDRCRSGKGDKGGYKGDSNKKGRDKSKDKQNEDSKKKEGRKTSVTVKDWDSSSYEPIKDFNQDPNDDEDKNPDKKSPDRIVSAAKHYVARIRRYFRLGLGVQEVARALDIPRENVLTDGPSQFQDQRSQLGSDIHAAHVIALRINPDVLRHGDLESVRTLINFVGHTQNVPRYANTGIVGRRIDIVQREYINSVINIDYSGNLSATDAATINRILESFRKMISKCLNEGKVESDHVKECVEALENLNNITPEEVFEDAKKGMDDYNVPPKKRQGPRDPKDKKPRPLF